MNIFPAKGSAKATIQAHYRNNQFSPGEETRADIRFFVVQYYFAGKTQASVITRLTSEDRVLYKCRLLPSTLEIIIEQRRDGERVEWVHNKGIVNDLAEALGSAIECKGSKLSIH